MNGKHPAFSDKLNRLSMVIVAGQSPTVYGYDDVGNLAGYTYPNGVTTALQYDQLNRLTNLASNANGAAVASYQYTLGAAGNRTSVTELSGRAVAYGYDNLYRLTSEAIANDLSGMNGAVGYTYDAVGNRKQITSTLPAISASGLLNYDANDRTLTDTYDNNGNTVSQGGVADSYDFENHLIQHGYITLLYDGDGNRVAKTVGGVTTNYLVDTLNPTGYAQVLDELQSNTVTRFYTWGLQLVSESQLVAATPPASPWVTSWYGYDGHGSVRYLTSSTGTVTDTYDYDAFGNLINSTGSTANNYLFAGEQFDPNLNLYYNRARYLDVRAGRFWGMDTEEGSPQDPATLHKYLYDSGNPVNRIDPSGHDDMVDLAISMGVNSTLSAMATTLLSSPLGNSVSSFMASHLIPHDVLQGLANSTPDAAEFGAYGQANLNARNPLVGFTGYGGFEFVGSLKTGNSALYGYYGAGITTGSTATSGGVAGNIGLVFNCLDSSQYSGNFVDVTVPLGALSSELRTKITTELLQVNIASFAGGIPVGYTSLLVALSKVSTTEFSSSKAITFFWSPDKHDLMGISLGVGASWSSGASTSNWALSGSYYWQLAPSQVVPFR